MSGSKRFVHLSPAEMTEMMKKKVSKSTTAATSNAVRTFLEF